MTTEWTPPTADQCRLLANVAEGLRSRRTARGWLPWQLADRAGETVEAVLRAERGQDFAACLLFGLADALDATVDSLRRVD